MNLKSEPVNVVNPFPRVSILSIKREISTTKLQDLVVPNAPSVSTPNIGPVAPKQLVPATTTPVLRRRSRVHHAVTADLTPSVTLVVVQGIDDHLLVLASLLLEILKLSMIPFLLKFIPPSLMTTVFQLHRCYWAKMAMIGLIFMIWQKILIQIS